MIWKIYLQNKKKSLNRYNRHSQNFGTPFKSLKIMITNVLALNCSFYYDYIVSMLLPFKDNFFVKIENGLFNLRSQKHFR